MLHKLFIHYLLERTAQGKRGLLIGFASSSASRHFPEGLHIYAATKALVKSMHNALIREIRDLDGQTMSDGARTELLDIQTILPSGA